MVRTVLVYGGGRAGFLAALTLKSRLPDVSVTLLRSREPGSIELGEGTTPTFGFHLHHYCNFDLKEFYRLAGPQWKIGTRLEWGPRPFFNHVFGFELDTKYHLLPRGTGYYLDNTEPFVTTGVQSGLMHENRIWLREPDGAPRLVADEFAYQLENEKLVSYLEVMVKERGIPVLDNARTEVLQDDNGVTGLRLESGRIITADLYVDAGSSHAGGSHATGSRSLLLGKTLGEPFHSYRDSLFCDRVVLGSWQRAEEPIKPYTTAETMSAGWCWQVEHERRVSRGYVYSSSFTCDEGAETEFRAQNPKVQATRIVPLRQGRYERFWVKNVVGVGDAAAVLEPLEDTALPSICLECQALAETLAGSALEPGPDAISNFNLQVARSYDAVRDFLAVHYRFNRRLDTPFWHECQEKVELHGAERVVEFYRENGPAIPGNATTRRNLLYQDKDWGEFGTEGYLALLVGQCVPYRSTYAPSAQDRQIWAIVQKAIRQKVASAFTVPEALALVRSKAWAWPKDLYERSRTMRL